MIKSFGDKTTELIWKGFQVRNLKLDIQRKGLRKLNIIDRATTLNDLRSPPGNNLEKKKGNLKDYHAIWINGQWRIIFIWKNGNAYKVKITDYH